MGAQVIVTLWDDADWSGLPTSNPGSGKPWKHSSGVLCVGAYVPADLSGYALDSAVVHKTGNETIGGGKLFSDGVRASTLYSNNEVASENVGSSRTMSILADGGGTYLRSTNIVKVQNSSGSSRQAIEVGSINVGPQLTIYSDNGSDVDFFQQYTGRYFCFRGFGDVRVGINKANPAATLDVNGSAAFSGLVNVERSISASGVDDALLKLRNTNSAVGSVAGEWRFGVGYSGSYDGYLKLVGPCGDHINDWTLALNDSDTPANRSVETPGMMVAPIFASNAQGLGPQPVVQWNPAGTNYNGTLLVGLGHPYGNHGVDIQLSEPSASPGNVAGTKFRVKNLDGSELFTVTNEAVARFSGLTFLGAKTFGTLPSASANSGASLRITDRSQRHAYSDGTDWRYFSDDSIVS